MNQHLKFKGLPWLLFEGQVTQLTGYGHNTVEKLIDCGTLLSVKPKGCAHRRFQKIQLAQLLGISLEDELEPFRREPLLLSEKSVLLYTGYTRKALRGVVAAGGLRPVRPAGLINARYRKAEVAGLLGLDHVL